MRCLTLRIGRLGGGLAYSALTRPEKSKSYVLDDGSPINLAGRAWIDPGLGGFLQTRDEWQDKAAENMNTLSDGFKVKKKVK